MKRRRPEITHPEGVLCVDEEEDFSSCDSFYYSSEDDDEEEKGKEEDKEIPWQEGAIYPHKNCWRVIGDRAEMQLTREQTVSFRAEFLEQIQKYTWRAKRGKTKEGNVFYAVSMTGGRQTSLNTLLEYLEHVRDEGDHPWNDGRKWKHKNRWRLVDDGANVQMKISQEKTTFFPVEDLERVQNFTWCASRSKKRSTGGRTFYAKSSGAKRKTGRGKLHQLLHDHEYLKVDHIDRDGLNNRNQNAREGSFGVNERNKCATSNTGILGVHRNDTGKCFQAKITLSTGRVAARFYWKNYESKEHAKKASNEWVSLLREEDYQRTSKGGCSEPIREEEGEEKEPKKRKRRKYSNNTSGHTGVSRYAKGWRAVWREEGRQLTKSFHSIKCGGDKIAKKLACAYREEMKMMEKERKRKEEEDEANVEIEFFTLPSWFSSEEEADE